MPYYLSLQFSAIQQAILRVDRLWSIAGMSYQLSKLNETTLPQLIEKNGGNVIIAGGGKITARFNEEAHANSAKTELIKEMSTTLPILEYQISDVVPADNFENAKEVRKSGDKIDYPGIITQLNENKRVFRGYGVTYNPHFRVCDECGEFPAANKHPKEKDIKLCRLCYNIFDLARIDLKKLLSNTLDEEEEKKQLTTIERVYKGYLQKLKISIDKKLEIPLNFEDITVKKDSDTIERLAVWFSDTNNMNEKVNLWLTIPDEDEILDVFNQVKETNIKIVIKALASTFDTIDSNKHFLPFRIIVAGGDDLCIVTKESYILRLTQNLSIAFNKVINNLEETNPLNAEWLKNESEKRGAGGNGFKKHCFGSSFIITSVHTPFKKIHSIGEGLLSEAKRETDRADNSVNWRITPEYDDHIRRKFIEYDRPLFIENPIEKAQLSFTQYLELVKYCADISNAHIYQIVSFLIKHKGNPELLELSLIKIPDTNKNGTPLNKILKAPEIRQSNGMLMPERLATLLELIVLSKRTDTI